MAAGTTTSGQKASSLLAFTCGNPAAIRHAMAIRLPAGIRQPSCQQQASASHHASTRHASQQDGHLHALLLQSGLSSMPQSHNTAQSRPCLWPVTAPATGPVTSCRTSQVKNACHEHDRQSLTVEGGGQRCFEKSILEKYRACMRGRQKTQRHVWIRTWSADLAAADNNDRQVSSVEWSGWA